VRLLRVLQEGEFERVGGKHTMQADVRIVAAASRPLADLVEAGSFREDLYYRLNVVPIHLPPLRDRLDDLPELATHFLQRLSAKYGKPVKGLANGLLAQMMAHDWPGNVRELENVLERSFLFSTGPVLSHLMLHDGATAGDGHAVEEAASDVATIGMPLKEAKKRAADRVEELILKDNLKRFHGNVSAMARHLQLTPRAVHQKLNAHNINPAKYRAAARRHALAHRSTG
jgi:DNA-binding NtrC family response regulator